MPAASGPPTIRGWFFVDTVPLPRPRPSELERLPSFSETKRVCGSLLIGYTLAAVGGVLLGALMGRYPDRALLRHVHPRADR
jgi:hypothetical protein